MYSGKKDKKMETLHYIGKFLHTSIRVIVGNMGISSIGMI